MKIILIAMGILLVLIYLAYGRMLSAIKKKTHSMFLNVFNYILFFYSYNKFLFSYSYELFYGSHYIKL